MTFVGNGKAALIGGAALIALGAGLFAAEPAALAQTAPAAAVEPVASPPLTIDELKQRVDAVILHMTAGTDPEFQVTAEGLTATEMRGDAVVAITPRLTLTSRHAETTTTTAEDGTVTTESGPQETSVGVIEPMTLALRKVDDRTIAFEMTVPSEIRVTTDGKPDGTVRIGRQTLKGTYIPAFETFDTLEMRLGDIAVSAGPDGSEGGARIGEIAYTGGLREVGAGLYDGVYDIRIAGMGFDVPEGDERSTFKLEDIRFTVTGQQMKMAEMGQAMREAGYTLRNPAYFDLMFQTNPNLDPKMIAFVKAIPNFVGGLAYEFAMKGAEATGEDAFRLSEVGGRFGIAAEGGGKATMSLGATLSSDDLGSWLEIPAEGGVRTFAFDVEVGGLPGQQLWESWVGAMIPAFEAAQEHAGDPAAQEQAMDQAMSAQEEKLTAETMAALQAARLAINLKRFELSGGSFTISGTGTGSYDPSGPGMPVGTTEFTVNGLLPLLTKAEARAAEDPAAASFVETFAMFRDLGTVVPGSDAGNPTYLLKFEALADGRMLANGQDLGGMSAPPEEFAPMDVPADGETDGTTKE